MVSLGCQTSAKYTTRQVQKSSFIVYKNVYIQSSLQDFFRGDHFQAVGTKYYLVWTSEKNCNMLSFKDIWQIIYKVPTFESTGKRTLCEASSLACNGSLWLLWTRWNDTAFFLSMNFFFFFTGWKWKVKVKKNHWNLFSVNITCSCLS